jgi:hypothetical protein
MTPIIPGIKDFPDLRLRYDAEMNHVKSSSFNGCSSCQKNQKYMEITQKYIRLVKESQARNNNPKSG